MRIALTHAFCWPEVRRGAERLVVELAGALAKHGHSVTILSSARARGRTTRDGVREIRFRRRHEFAPAAEAYFGRRLVPALAASRYDIVHSHGRRDAVASLQAARLHPNRGIVYTDVGVPLRAWLEENRHLVGDAARVAQDVDVYGCMSQHALDTLARDYGRAGTLLPGGVDTSTFVPTDVRSPHPTILFSGAIDEPRKGVATLLEALPLIAEVEPDVRLQLSGPGDATALLSAATSVARERTDLLGRGSIGDQPGRYARAWTTALPANHETFGLVLLESLSSGTPVVAADNSALPEMVTPGVTGSLCTFGDAASVAAACISSIALARRGDIADACRASAEPYDWFRGVAPICIDAYQSALEMH